MSEIYYIERTSKKQEQELVFGEKTIRYMYGSSFFGTFLQKIVSKWSIASKLYGLIQSSRWSRRKIRPFVTAFDVDLRDCVETIEKFTSFNDFFIRKLRPECRPISESSAIIPADGRYLFSQNIETHTPFCIKGTTFCLETFLQDKALSDAFSEGTVVRARLCPTDCHRFYFPCDGVPEAPRLINGSLFSVNPIATLKNPKIWSENKRWIIPIQTEAFGKVLYVPIGATSVGSIVYTYTPHKHYKKGDEVGYFMFGGSAIVLVFQKNTISLSKDLQQYTNPELEVLCLIGQSLGEKTQ